MLKGDKIIGIYCIVDDILKGIGYKDDSRRKVSDSEIITTAVVSALYFDGRIDNSRWDEVDRVCRCWIKVGSIEDYIKWKN